MRAQEAGIGESVGGGEVRELDLDQVRNINRFEGLFGGGGDLFAHVPPTMLILDIR